VRLRLLPLAALLAACAATQPPPPRAPEAASAPPRVANEGPTFEGQRDLTTMMSFFTGNWDAKPGEPPMHLRVAEFWKGSPVRWLYLEWFRPGEESQPRRQLVFRIAEDGPERMTTTVHRLPDDASRFAGEWRKPQPFAALSPADLRVVGDCRLKTLRAMIAHFVLVTEGNRCPGDLPGAPFMRFEFSLTSSDLDLLEQPRDAAGRVPPGSRLLPFRYARMSRVPK
jgi:hypothetical protein